jgi:ADP-dependent NAD(P)H-hydrate dehydratase / NAD(P)H-hydrate epimerase
MQGADHFAIQEIGIPEMILMEHAALGIVEALERRFRGLLKDTRGLVVAGPGNNGADAFAVARLLQERGVKLLQVLGLRTKDAEGEMPRLQTKLVEKLGIPIQREINKSFFVGVDWIVDGIFGTGLGRAPSGDFAKAIDLINLSAKSRWIVAIDLPSGLSSDTGMPLGATVEASETIALGFYKRGHVTGRAADYVGALSLRSIQIPRKNPHSQVDTFLFEPADAEPLPQRLPSGHKGSYGHVYVWAGTEERQGASLLSAVAALRSGCGLVTLVGHSDDLAKGRSHFPLEVMTENDSETFFSQQPRQVGVLGPGFGTGKAQWSTLVRALQSDWNLVLDADALTLLAQYASEAQPLLRARKGLTVLTPHPKEAARLLGKGEAVAEIQEDRYLACRAIAETYHAFVVLKGKGTITTGPGDLMMVVQSGTTALSKGGTGDVLAGILGSLLAQKVPAPRALPLGCYLHGRASEILSQQRGEERSELAGEIANTLSLALGEIESWRATG